MVHLLDGSGNQLYLDPATGVYTTDASAGFPAVEIATDGDGKYLFDGLPAGDYKVKFDPPAGLALTFQDRSGDDDADSDADRATGISQTVSVVGGDAIRNVDAGLIVGNNSIGDRVWSDANGDGIQDDVISRARLARCQSHLYNADTGQALQDRDHRRPRQLPVRQSA